MNTDEYFDGMLKLHLDHVSDYTGWNWYDSRQHFSYGCTVQLLCVLATRHTKVRQHNTAFQMTRPMAQQMNAMLLSCYHVPPKLMIWKFVDTLRACMGNNLHQLKKPLDYQDSFGVWNIGDSWFSQDSGDQWCHFALKSVGDISPQMKKAYVIWSSEMRSE